GPCRRRRGRPRPLRRQAAEASGKRARGISRVRPRRHQSPGRRAHAVPAHRNRWARGHDRAASRRHRRGRQHGGVRSRHRRDQRQHLQLRRLDRRARGLRADVGSVHLRHARARVHRSCRDSWHAGPAGRRHAGDGSRRGLRPPGSCAAAHGRNRLPSPGRGSRRRRDRERPGDPGADDLSSYFGPAALPAITEAIEGLAPRDIEDGRLNTLAWWGDAPTLDIVDVTSDVSHLSLQLSGIATIQATVYPREWGIVAGSCEVSAALPVTATATFSLGFNPDHDRPRVIIHSLAASATINYLTATGEVWAAWDPFPLSCHNAVESHIRDRVIERIDELTSGLADNQEVKQALAGVNKMFDPADL